MAKLQPAGKHEISSEEKLVPQYHYKCILPLTLFESLHENSEQLVNAEHFIIKVHLTQQTVSYEELDSILSYPPSPLQ